MSIFRTKQLAISLCLKACAHENLDPTQARLTFSHTNPYRSPARRASALLARAWRGGCHSRLPR